MREIDTLIIHCSDTPPDMHVDAGKIDGWHKARGWDGIGYHFVLLRDGRIEQGRPIEDIGAHAAGHNAHSIGVCLIGGRGADGQPDSNFTRAQWEVLAELVDDLWIEYGPLKVIGHRDVSDKACPCFDVDAWMEHP